MSGWCHLSGVNAEPMAARILGGHKGYAGVHIDFYFHLEENVTIHLKYAMIILKSRV